METSQEERDELMRHMHDDCPTMRVPTRTVSALRADADRLAQYERDLNEEIGKDRSQDVDWLRAGFLQRGAEIERLKNRLAQTRCGDPQDLIDRLPRHHSEAVAQLIEERDSGFHLTRRLLDTIDLIREATGTEHYELAQLPEILALREDERVRLYKRLEQIQQIAKTITPEGLRALDDVTIRQVFADAALQPEITE